MVSMGAASGESGRETCVAGPRLDGSTFGVVLNLSLGVAFALHNGAEKLNGRLVLNVMAPCPCPKVV